MNNAQTNEASISMLSDKSMLTAQSDPLALYHALCDMTKDLTEKTNEVARLRELLTEFYDTLDIGGYHHGLCNIETQDSENWDLGCNCEIADLKKKYIELMSTAPAPEEPVIQENRTTEPVPLEIEKQLPAGYKGTRRWDDEPEYRELGPDEVICEGDEYDPCYLYKKEWVPVRKEWIGTKVTGSEHEVRFRTRRPLPKQEEMPLAKMMECFLGDYPDAGKAIYDAIYNLRDEIQKLKHKNTND